MADIIGSFGFADGPTDTLYFARISGNMTLQRQLRAVSENLSSQRRVWLFLVTIFAFLAVFTIGFQLANAFRPIASISTGLQTIINLAAISFASLSVMSFSRHQAIISAQIAIQVSAAMNDESIALAQAEA